MHLQQTAKLKRDTRKFSADGRKLLCTSCKEFREFNLVEFLLRSVRGKRMQSRWCATCTKSYAKAYDHLTGNKRAYRGSHGPRLSMELCRAVVADTRKALAIALTHKLSLSTVYRIKSVARKLTQEGLTNSKIGGKLEKQSNLNKQGIQNAPDQNPT